MRECEKFDPVKKIVLSSFQSPENGRPVDFLVVRPGTTLQTGPWPDSDRLELNYPTLLRVVTGPAGSNGNGSISVEIVTIGKESQKIPRGIHYLPTP